MLTRSAGPRGHVRGTLHRTATVCPYCRERDCAHIILRFRARDAIARLYMWSEFGVNTVHAAPGPHLATKIVNVLSTYRAIQRDVIYGTEWGREYARREVLVYLREAGLEVDSGET